MGTSGSSASLGSLSRVGVAPRGRLGSPVTAQGLILGALGVSRAPFWELWDPSGSIFGSFGRLRRLLGALGEAPRAPRAAWMSPGVDFGSQMEAKREPKSF